MATRDVCGLGMGLGAAAWLWWWPDGAPLVGVAAGGTAVWAWHREQRLRALARDLHDGLGAHLAALVLAADLCTQSGGGREVRERAEDALAELRHVLAVSRRRLDLEAAVRADCHRAAARSGWKMDCRIDLQGVLSSSALGLEVLRSLQELLSNVARHADARLVRVQLQGRGGWLRLVVEDDGRGFRTGSEPAGLHFGLSHLRVRARRYRGDLAIGASEAGGARVSLSFCSRRWWSLPWVPGRRRPDAATAGRRSFGPAPCPRTRTPSSSGPCSSCEGA